MAGRFPHWQSATLALGVALATGCSTIPLHRHAPTPAPEIGDANSGKSAQPSFDTQNTPPSAAPPQPDPAVQQVQAVEAPATMPPIMVAPPAGLPAPMLDGGVPTAMGVMTDPHLRATPTAGGALLNLAPNESPLDRALELVRRVELAAAENRTLISRIATLEARAKEREQALDEGLRDVDSASAEVTRARAEMAALRKEMTAIRNQMRKMEQEEIETLKAVITALEKLMERTP